MGIKGPMLQDESGPLQGADHSRPCRQLNDFGLYAKKNGEPLKGFEQWGDKRRLALWKDLSPPVWKGVRVVMGKPGDYSGPGERGWVL